MTIHEPEMRRADGAIFLTVAENDRLAISTSIERLIDLLDAMEPDPDLEPWLGIGDDREGDLSDLEPGQDDEFSLGWTEDQSQTGNLSAGSYGTEGDLEHDLGWTHSERLGRYKASWITDGEEDAGDDREQENEHGGDIQDEPHDALDEGNDEPSLGWGNRTGLTGVGMEGWATTDGGGDIGQPLSFQGEGYSIGKAALRELKQRRPDKPQAYVKTSAGLPTVATASTDWWKSGDLGDVQHLKIMPGATRIPTDTPDWLAHWRAAKGL